MKKIILSVFLCFTCLTTFGQNIKSIQLRPLQENNFSAIVPLGTVLELSFDDLEADQRDYQYKIQHMTHDWQKSRLLSSQFVDGFDQNSILNVTNSFNTFQSYSHYSVKIPNVNTVITKSGNYLLSVLNDDDEVLFTRRFVLYEKAAIAGVVVSRSRNTKTLNKQQSVEFSVNYPNLRVNNPSQEINVVVIKNDNWNETLTDLQPTFFKPSQLQYSYTPKNNFWGGNEYLNFDSKFIRNQSMNIVRIEQKGVEVFHHYIFPYSYNPYEKYTYNPDINGQFIIRTLEGNDPATEADYAMMHFTLNVEDPFIDRDVYIYGAFNNFEIQEENKMYFDDKSNAYKGTVLLKQGFYNYTFVTVNRYEEVNNNEVRGSFFETENEYKVLVYYRPMGGFYDRVVTVGSGSFNADR
ncbi:DUF5103 domain-containing protein [Polaribacter porphyrae]|uniref:DUF5103 domain-containing protein n=1 Tax=Polaribacter porphyrae TaxID=1137780 RepID=A0A2S7WU06_9FLAO|nr:DUF5103 domain-containing protein [Polaribacter porphyrae]PQJ80966.1 DUF5103 domain-containing protein [Polaribacter porphyrae]